MEGGIYGIYGGFGSGKTLGAVILIIKKLSRGEIVFSNIRLNKNLIPNPQNYYFFDDFANFYDVLAFSGIFAMEVSRYNKKQIDLGFVGFKRNSRPKINVFFDETGIFANSKDWLELHKDYGKDLQQYILQVRKLFVSLYLIIQRPAQLVADLRCHIHYWITFKPLLNIDWLGKYSGSYWIQELNSDTFDVICEKKQAYDTDGNYYNYEVPQEKILFRVWWKPFYFSKYDDLYLNKLFETKFRTNYLYSSNLLSNLKLGFIKNNSLVSNSHIYENLLQSADIDIEDFKSPEVPYFSNPVLNNYLFYLKIKSFFLKKYYFKDFFKYFFTKKESNS